jgi:hypothetical protein
MPSVCVCARARARGRPLLRPEKWKELRIYSYWIFKSLCIVGLCLTNKDVIAQEIGALYKVPKHRISFYIEDDCSHFHCIYSEF